MMIMLKQECRNHVITPAERNNCKKIVDNSDSVEEAQKWLQNWRLDKYFEVR